MALRRSEVRFGGEAAERNPDETITELVNGTFRVRTSGSVAFPAESDRLFNNFEQLEAVSAVGR
jgi:hypothetical protein